jgi:CoA:oxalate CoA-transferase
MANAPRMLEGYRVLDFTQFVAGPTCTRLMAELGAEVVKLELAPGGDRIREAGFKPRDNKSSSHSTYYMQHDHSKLSFTIDMKRPGARELVMSMIPKFDVLVENFAPGVIGRMGFSYEDVKKVNPPDHHVFDLDGGPIRTAVQQGGLRHHRTGLRGSHRQPRRAGSRADHDWNGDR